MDRRVIDEAAICILKTQGVIRLTIELPSGEGLSVNMRPTDFDHLLSLGATVLNGIASHCHMKITHVREPNPLWQPNDLN